MHLVAQGRIASVSITLEASVSGMHDVVVAGCSALWKLKLAFVPAAAAAIIDVAAIQCGPWRVFMVLVCVCCRHKFVAAAVFNS